MFVDTASVRLRAGNGGDGRSSFRREKFVDRGGPDGGDGGQGGDIVFMSSTNQDTLANFRYARELKAESGQPGGTNRKHGKSGANLIVAVPVGTIIADDSGQLLADLTKDGDQVVVARGGLGGYGNAHFVSSTRQAPKVAEKGEHGQSLVVTLELKMIADVGLVGLPNAGKSTLLSVISAARPEIANYPFTTLTPNLGMVDIDKKHSLLFADIPGLIEGASVGKGLGDEFLRHVERTLMLVHLIDAYQEDITQAYKTVQAELAAYKLDLTRRPQIVVLNKVEGLDKDIVKDLIVQLKTVLPAGRQVMAISAQSHEGLDQLIAKVWTVVLKERAKLQKVTDKLDKAVPVLRLPDNLPSWQVTKQNSTTFLISGPKIERFARRTNFNSEEGLRRLRDIMKKMGISHELTKQGIKPGDKVVIGSVGQFDY